jgi:hypothetical protein
MRRNSGDRTVTVQKAFEQGKLQFPERYKIQEIPRGIANDTRIPVRASKKQAPRQIEYAGASPQQY